MEKEEACKGQHEDGACAGHKDGTVSWQHTPKGVRLSFAPTNEILAKYRRKPVKKENGEAAR